MAKLAPYFFAVMLAAFLVGVAGAALYYSWNALSVIFPGDLLGQSFGIMLFDISAFVWFGTFVYLSRSIFQYVWAGVGFLVGFSGSIGLIALEIGMNSGVLQFEDVQKPMTYIFIGVLFVHLLLAYARHSAAPETSADISIGVEKAKIAGEAQKAVEKKLSEKMHLLADAISNDLLRGVLRDLRITVSHGDVLDAPSYEVAPVNVEPEAQGKPVFLSWLQRLRASGGRSRSLNAQSVAMSSSPVTPKPSPAPTDAGNGAHADEEPKP